MNVLQWAREHGCVWCSATCEAAASGGHLAVLQYIHQNGCDWNSYMCEAAASEGHLAVLQYLHQNGCPWDSRTSVQAAVNNYLELLRWARQQQPPCPWWFPQCHGDSTLQWYLLHRWRSPSPCMLVYLTQQQAHLPPRHRACARVFATAMTNAFLVLRAALPDKTPHEVVLSIVTLAFSEPSRPIELARFNRNRMTRAKLL